MPANPGLRYSEAGIEVARLCSQSIIALLSELGFPSQDWADSRKGVGVVMKSSGRDLPLGVGPGCCSLLRHRLRVPG